MGSLRAPSALNLNKNKTKKGVLVHGGEVVADVDRDQEHRDPNRPPACHHRHEHLDHLQAAQDLEEEEVVVLRHRGVALQNQDGVDQWHVPSGNFFWSWWTRGGFDWSFCVAVLLYLTFLLLLYFLLLVFPNNNQAGGSEESTATGNIQVNSLMFDVNNFIDQM